MSASTDRRAIGRASRLVWLIALGATSAAAAPPAGAEPEIRFFWPREQATVLGKTEVRLHLALPAGAEVERVVLSVDGRPMATLAAPPWHAEWDAGNGETGHRLEAFLHLRDGRSTRTTVHTSALQIDQIERVHLVDLYVTVRDPQGRYAIGLGQEAFRVLENERPQTIERFSSSTKPLRVGIVLDSSWTMRGEKLERAKEAALQFLEILEPTDEGLVVTFADEVVVGQELTRERQALVAAIEAAEAAGGTALYDAVWRTGRLLAGFDGRRVLVLLSDGRDEAANGFGPGSLHTVDEAVEQSLRNEVMVFAIGLGGNLPREYVRTWNGAGELSQVDPARTVVDVLRRLSEATGGRLILASSAGRISRAFDEIAADLHHQYSIAYASTDAARDGKWRRIEVLTPGRELEVVTRKGYYAPHPAERRPADSRP